MEILKELLMPTLNVVILSTALFLLIRPKFRAFVTARHNEIREKIEKNSILLKQAREQYEDFSARLLASARETESIRNQMKRDAENSAAAVVGAAKQAAGSLIQDAKRASEQLFVDVKNELRAELAAKIVERAEKTLSQKITGEDRTRIRVEFSKTLETLK